ncbi:fungal-specific transcription factor domain-containing protein [Phyllosticta citriasiana]|uniref:fungal-specific transcription factor domain-containing protein n=1 Tax=Phyllosticta citriasiana TaxID=595635 RepID=UPI0030FD5240
MASSINDMGSYAQSDPDQTDQRDDPLNIADYALQDGHTPNSASSIMSAFPKWDTPTGATPGRSTGGASGAPANGGLTSAGSVDGIDTDTSPQSGFGFGDPFGDGGSQTNAGDAGSGTTKGSKSKEDDRDTDAPPPWSEMKTKAGKERKRLPLACIACRRKKIRCSGEKPACKHCLRSRIPCVYKVTTRKAAPRTDYMAMLDKRLKRMEDRIIKLVPKESMATVAAVGRAVVKPPLPGAPQKGPNAKKRPADEAFGQDLEDWSKKGANVGEKPPGLPPKTESEEGSLLTEGADALPPKDIQEHLAEVYFDYVYGQSYPLLHKPSFMRRLAAGQVPPVLILAVCAISARFSTHPQIRSEPAFLRGENWAARARDIALKRYDTPNITILISYLLLGLYEFGTCQGGRSWMFGGMAQRMAYALQLHKDLDHDPLGKEKGARSELSFTDREIRRRTMWSCFIMDRFNSSGTDRPLFVSGQFIHVQLPIREHYFQMEIPGNVRSPIADAKENMGVVAYLVRAVAIWGRLEQEKLKKQARQFKESLPERLLWTQENLENHEFIFLHIVYHQVVLFLNRFSLPSHAGSRPPRDMPHQFLTEAAHAALDSANQISLLINEALNHHVAVPFAGYFHIRGVFSKNPKLEIMSKRYLAYNVKYLSKMKRYWGMFHFVAENLKELYRQHADAALRGPAAVNGTQTNIFQYGDWFDRYPHGVSRTDYEDPAVDAPKEAGTDAVLGQKPDLQSVEEFFASLSPTKKTTEPAKKARRGKNEKENRSKHQSANASSSNRPDPSPTSGNVNPSPFPIPSPSQNQPFNANTHTSPDPATSPGSAFPGGPVMGPSFNSQPMSALDRQMVLQSYATFMDRNEPFALDPSVMASTPGFADPANPSAHASDNLFAWGAGNLSAGFGAAAGMGDVGGAINDPSLAWFMPFNVDPPLPTGGSAGSGGGGGGGLSDDGGGFFAGFGGLGVGFGGFGLDGGSNSGVGGPADLGFELDEGSGNQGPATSMQ